MRIGRMTAPAQRIWALAGLLLASSALLARSCPLRCKCEEPRVVDCSFQTLTEFPEIDDEDVIKLDLTGNFLTKLPEDLGRLAQLRVLNLKNNNLRSLPVGISNLKSLYALDLSENYFPNASSLDLISLLPALEILNIADNPITSLGGLSSQTVFALDATKCKIRELNYTSLIQLPNLNTLKLADNPLQRLNRPFAKHLKSLYLSRCELEYLRPDAFAGFPELRILDLSGNPRLIYSTKFGSLTHPKLLKIDLSNCRLDVANLTNLPSLLYANFAGNKINDIADHAFLNNSALNHLILSRNLLTRVKKNSFAGLSNLRILDLAENKLYFVHPDAFRENHGDLYLNLAFNHLAEFPYLNVPKVMLNITGNSMMKGRKFNLPINMGKVDHSADGTLTGGKSENDEYFVLGDPETQRIIQHIMNSGSRPKSTHQIDADLEPDMAILIFDYGEEESVVSEISRSITDWYETVPYWYLILIAVGLFLLAYLIVVLARGLVEEEYNRSAKDHKKIWDKIAADRIEEHQLIREMESREEINPFPTDSTEKGMQRLLNVLYYTSETADNNGDKSQLEKGYKPMDNHI